uniref:Uncharacterized protein n=1 Tax=Cacopsylla melanoneura TaxID=428564 RepID=A0A8D8T3U9_9HEMI
MDHFFILLKLTRISSTLCLTHSMAKRSRREGLTRMCSFGIRNSKAYENLGTEMQSNAYVTTQSATCSPVVLLLTSLFRPRTPSRWKNTKQSPESIAVLGTVLGHVWQLVWQTAQ